MDHIVNLAHDEQNNHNVDVHVIFSEDENEEDEGFILYIRGFLTNVESEFNAAHTYFSYNSNSITNTA